MSGHRWIHLFLIALALPSTGCEVTGGKPALWNPFARADKNDGMDAEPLPKFVRRTSDDDTDKTERPTVPIAESRVEALLADGQRALQENRIPEAQRAYSEVLQFLPDNATAHHGMAMAADLTEQWAEAENHYRQALRSRPRDANLLCDIGYSYLLQNRYSEASSYLTQAIQIEPNHENAHTNLAMLDLRQGNHEAGRQRIVQRFGNTAKATQILAALEAQTSAKIGAGLVASAPEIPANATFDEVRELARREKVAAEQRRAAQTMPAAFNAESQALNRLSTSEVGPGNAGPGNAGPGNVSAAIHEQEFQQAPLAGPVSAPAGNAQTSAGSGATAPSASQFGVSGTAGNVPGYAPQGPGGVNPDPNQGFVNSVAANAFNGSSTPGMSSYPNPAANPEFAGANQPAFNGNNIPMSPATNMPGSGGVISVRPSGAFQPPAQGVSYGQPMGFGQVPVETAGYQHQSAGPPVGNADYRYGAGSPQNNWQGQQNPNQQAGQNLSNLQLEGLNAGPGSLFPIGQNPNSSGSGMNPSPQGSMNSQMTPANPYASGQYPGGQPPMAGARSNVGPQDGTVRMENVSAPGSNSVINGAMYGQPVSTLPSQEWMMQQQQQIQQLQQQQPRNGSSGYSYPGSNGSAPQGSQFGNSSSTTAPRPGVQPQPTNPLATYENQLRQLDNQYNSTLQQMDRNATANVPRAQY